MQQNIGHNKHFTESVSILQVMNHDEVTFVPLSNPDSEGRHPEAELVVVAARGVEVRVRGQPEAGDLV